MLNVNFFVSALALTCVIHVHCILSASKLTTATEKNNIKKADNAVAQSIDRDYIAGYDESYGHGGYGLSAHASYGFPEAHESYGVIEGGKHHIHHAEDHHHHHHEHHKHYDYAHNKALAIKSLLVPLAGVALLGAAAAFVSNPILLQLGVISGAPLGRRKRSPDFNSTMSEEHRIRLNEIKLLERFMSENPGQDIHAQEKQMLANYLSCSGVTMKNFCLERLTCELHSVAGTSMPMEANVLTIVVNEILDNRFVPVETKTRLSRAVQRGQKNFGCEVYDCEQLEQKGKS